MNTKPKKLDTSKLGGRAWLVQDIIDQGFDVFHETKDRTGLNGYVTAISGFTLPIIEIAEAENFKVAAIFRPDDGGIEAHLYNKDGRLLLICGTDDLEKFREAPHQYRTSRHWAGGWYLPPAKEALCLFAE